MTKSGTSIMNVPKVLVWLNIAHTTNPMIRSYFSNELTCSYTILFTLLVRSRQSWRHRLSREQRNNNVVFMRVKLSHRKLGISPKFSPEGIFCCRSAFSSFVLLLRPSKRGKNSQRRKYTVGSNSFEKLCWNFLTSCN